MGENSAIEWTDATVNFWWGCTKVGPGCDNCYAEKWSRRTGGDHWGVGVLRRKINGAVALMHRLDNGYSNWAADHEAASGNARALGLPQPSWGRRRRVFVQSMSDLFDLEVPVEWFAEAWRTIKTCNRIDIQIVTKRTSAVRKRLAEIGETEWPRHAGLLISVVNQPEVDRDVPRLLDLKVALGIPWVGLSMEPLLGPVDLSAWMSGCHECQDVCGYRSGEAPEMERCAKCDWEGAHAGEFCPCCGDQVFFGVCPDCGADVISGHPDTPVLDWVIAGGESGPGARPMHPDWARSLRDQCKTAGVPFLFKQWGEWAPHVVRAGGDLGGDVRAGRVRIVHPTGEDDVAVFSRTGINTIPGSRYMVRVGKKIAGRLLDGREHNDTPKGGDRG